ncbi:DUF4221 family protein [Algoriphagus halophytocola]|uniref:DUF4221 family protein n=1 Tax=Algoriphagus halophytocola TaxID=2991499 RepID=UPI0022DDD7FF|nr:DUF4221 family protein [Algoriphagus sp. TR-M9]WBL42848.1 DUF4221 family protein [Algoriphagus sp. TR-M9]
MNRLLAFLFVPVIFSCSAKLEKEEVLAEESSALLFDYTLDTVIIDSGDSKPYLDMKLVSSDYVASEGLLYNLDPGTGRVDVIDIAAQKLTDQIQFEIDGPNGIRRYFPTGIKKTSGDDLIIRDYYDILRMGTDKKLKDSYRLRNHTLAGDNLRDGQEINGMGEVAQDGTFFASYYGYYPSNGPIMGLAKVDFASKSLRLIPVDFKEQSAKLTIRWDFREGKSTVIPEFKFLTLDKHNFIASNTYKNELWYYDAGTDSVYHRVYKSKLTANVKRGNFRKRVRSMREYTLAKNRKYQEVVFGPIVKDPTKQLFYRYSREVQQVPDRGGSFFRFVLTVFDDQLNQVHEEKLALSAAIPGEYYANKTFVHQGMLYTFLDLKSQLAFVRLKPTFYHEKN